jgi:hypothetical protein
MGWFLVPIVLTAGIIFIWRYEKYLDELTGPWIFEQMKKARGDDF